MTAKADIVEAYFVRWQDDLDRAKDLLADQKYYLEAWLVLSCYIGAFASLRFPTLRGTEAYKGVVLQYSGMKDFYEQIDLLFFLQWPRSEFSTHGDFLKLKNHPDLVKRIQGVFGDENTITNQQRYVSQSEFLAAVSQISFPGFDYGNLQEYLPLFSNVELLYRYVRCHAVHAARFPFVTRVHVVGSGTRYEDNHAITGSVLYKTAVGVLNRLKSQCMSEDKWPWDL